MVCSVEWGLERCVVELICRVTVVLVVVMLTRVVVSRACFDFDSILMFVCFFSSNKEEMRKARQSLDLVLNTV